MYFKVNTTDREEPNELMIKKAEYLTGNEPSRVWNDGKVFGRYKKKSKSSYEKRLQTND